MPSYNITNELKHTVNLSIIFCFPDMKLYWIRNALSSLLTVQGHPNVRRLTHAFNIVRLVLMFFVAGTWVTNLCPWDRAEERKKRQKHKTSHHQKTPEIGEWRKSRVTKIAQMHDMTWKKKRSYEWKTSICLCSHIHVKETSIFRHCLSWIYWLPPSCTFCLSFPSILHIW